MENNKADSGKFFWRKRWYSICSAHQSHKEDCNMCNVGSWHNVWLSQCSNIIYRISPKAYTWLLRIF